MQGLNHGVSLKYLIGFDTFDVDLEQLTLLDAKPFSCRIRARKHIHCKSRQGVVFLVSHHTLNRGEDGTKQQE